MILIKPSHYDDRGYVIRWKRSVVPSNTLATLYGLMSDCIERRVLGDHVEIECHAIDETNSRIDVPAIISMIRDAGGGLVGLVGVQSNQFPRAMDLAREFRAAGVAVSIGGFHVSGCLAMLPGVQPDLQEALDLGISLYAGEVEGRLEDLLRDAANGAMKPIYNYLKDLPGLEDQPVPFLPREIVIRGMGVQTSFDAGRGCPFQCSFCTIINVQGRKSRRRSADDVERIVRSNLAQGVDHVFITDDDLIVMASEVGVLDIPEEKIVKKWRLQPGKMLLVDLEQGRIIDDAELKADLCGSKPYQGWLDETQIRLSTLPLEVAPMVPDARPPVQVPGLSQA